MISTTKLNKAADYVWSKRLNDLLLNDKLLGFQPIGFLDWLADQNGLNWPSNWKWDLVNRLKYWIYQSVLITRKHINTLISIDLRRVNSIWTVPLWKRTIKPNRDQNVGQFFEVFRLLRILWHFDATLKTLWDSLRSFEIFRRVFFKDFMRRSGECFSSRIFWSRKILWLFPSRSFGTVDRFCER